MTLTEKLEFLLADYEPISDPQERMALVVESIPAATRLPETLRTDEHRIKGCISAASAAEISSCELDPLLSLGLTRSLSPTRLNGLTQARRRIREIAASLA